MLEDAAGIRRVVLACGAVDLRKGIDGLSMIIGDKYHQNPFEKGTLFLFCGKRSDRIKGLLWMGDGFLLLYKRFEAGSLSWPRNTQEAAELTEEQFQYLMLGLNPLDPKIKQITPRQAC
jgi:transposase